MSSHGLTKCLLTIGATLLSGSLVFAYDPSQSTGTGTQQDEAAGTQTVPSMGTGSSKNEQSGSGTSAKRERSPSNEQGVTPQKGSARGGGKQGTAPGSGR